MKAEAEGIRGRGGSKTVDDVPRSSHTPHVVKLALAQISATSAQHTTPHAIEHLFTIPSSPCIPHSP
jgi:hypothetical protein